GGAILGLFPAKYYASLGEAPAPGSFKGFELAMNLGDAALVDRVYATLEAFADVRLRGPPKDLSLGGRALSFLHPGDTAWWRWGGGTAIGGGAPVAVQSMCTTLTHDVDATIRQIELLQEAGCEIARVAVP